jgi:hypothetical protein
MLVPALVVEHSLYHVVELAAGGQEAISDKVENTKTCDISCMNDIKMRMQKLEESVESKFTIMNIEFRHKLELHETKAKHDLETMRLKTEIDRLRQQENRNHSCEIRTHANLLLYELWSLWQGSLYMCYWLL